MKIRTRLILGFLLIAGSGLYYLTDWIIKELRPNYLKAMEESLVDAATLLSSLVTVENDTINYSGLKEAFSDAGERRFHATIYDVVKDRMNIRAYITDAKGIVVFDSQNSDNGKDFSSWNDVNRALQGKYGARSTRAHPDDSNSSILYIASPIIVKDSIAGVLTVAKPADSVALFINSAQKKILFTSIYAGAGVLLFACLLSIWVTVPIHRIISFARSMRTDTVKTLPKLHPLGILGQNEMDELANALVEMRDALENKQYVEKYVQTLTHEIKSPLSAIRGAAELIDDQMPAPDRIKFIDNIKNETARIQNMVERLLELSNLENRHGLRAIELVECNQLIQDILSSLEPVFKRKNVSISMDCKELITIRAERFLLRQSIVNLIQNSLDFLTSGDVIGISLYRDDNIATIKIEDNGPGIPNYALKKIFDRFYSLPRPQSNLKSTGLGLSFVKEAVSLHGGTAQLENRPEGGVCAVLYWPINPAN